MVAAHCVAAKNIFLHTIHRCCFSTFGSRKVLIAAHPPTLTRSHTRLQTSHRIPSSAPTTHTMARKTRTPTTHFTGTTVARPDRTTVRYFCRLLGTDHLAMLCNVLDRADFDAKRVRICLRMHCVVVSQLHAASLLAHQRSFPSGPRRAQGLAAAPAPRRPGMLGR